jgi:hypothetical protein
MEFRLVVFGSYAATAEKEYQETNDKQVLH